MYQVVLTAENLVKAVQLQLVLTHTACIVCIYASTNEQVEQLEAEHEELGRELAYVGRELQELKAAYAQADRAAGI
jgi:hypothetical protein